MIKNIFICLKIAIMAQLFLLLVCCNTPKRVVKKTTSDVPYKIDGASDKHRLKLKNKLAKQGVQIITVGQNYLIIIPSAYIFADKSERVVWRSYSLLNDVACYLRQFRKVSVTINSHTAYCISPKHDRALTLARSRAVADYIWSQGINAQLIFTYGVGSDKPIYSSKKTQDKSKNSRIEISFQEAIS